LDEQCIIEGRIRPVPARIGVEAEVGIHIDKAKKIAYIRLTGQPDKKVILNAFDAAVEHGDYQPGMGRLWDLREADLSGLDASTISEMAKYSARFPPGINDVRVAFVAGRELEYGLSRMFAAFSETVATTISVFYSIDEAEAWLMS
jgi:hypothetical protein